MFEILKEINETTFVGCENNNIYILKKIHIEEIEIYKKLTNVECKNISKIFGTAVIGESIYAVCEYVSGLTLKAYCEKNGKLSDADVKNFSSQLCDGLKSIHSVGIVHRDITPNNVMLTNDGTVKIIDFGISRIRKSNRSSDTEILGTHGYAAPEQYGFSQTNEKADIYSVGVLINFMKTGCLPAEKLAAGEIGKIVRKCTQMDENKRYKDITSLKCELNSSNKLKRLINGAVFLGNGNFLSKIPLLVYYMIATMLTISMFRDPPESDKLRPFEFGVPALIVFFIPPLVTCNSSFTERWYLIKDKSKAVKYIVRFLLGIGTMLLAFFCFICIDFFLFYDN